MGNVHMEATQINYRGGSSKMNVEEAIKSAIELTPEQKTNINKIPTIEEAVGNKTDQDVIAPEFDAESGTYAIGDLVMYEGKLYEFTSAHETAGDWNSEEVSEKTVADEIGDVKSGLTNVNSDIANLKLNNFSMDSNDIKDYNTSANKYTFPTDGYLVAAVTNDDIIVNIFGSLNNYVMLAPRLNNNSVVYVRKGMRCYVATNTGSNSVYFVGLI